jgi:hypothetical protein
MAKKRAWALAPFAAPIPGNNLLGGVAMSWSLERVFYGHKEGLNLRSMWDFLRRGFYSIPHTLFNGYYRAVRRVGDHDHLYSRISKPFPDALLAQRPEGKFAVQLSGGFDSSIVAKVYDAEDVDYIHFTGPESYKARALAATLKGKLHEIQLTPEMFIREAEELMPLMTEPYTFEDVVYCYIAGKKAKELGHTLVVTGDGGDWVFGGFNVGAGSIDAESADIWKTLEPNRILGLQTLMPLGHQVLDLWSRYMLRPEERTVEKPFARRYCEELGLPREIVTQKKVPWSGSHGIMDNAKSVRHMESVVENSSYSWVTDFRFFGKPRNYVLFRQYGLVKWLEANYKARLEPREIQGFTRQVREFNAREGKVASTRHVKDTIKWYFPPAAIDLGYWVQYRMQKHATV